RKQRLYITPIREREMPSSFFVFGQNQSNISNQDQREADKLRDQRQRLEQDIRSAGNWQFVSPQSNFLSALFGSPFGNTGDVPSISRSPLFKGSDNPPMGTTSFNQMILDTFLKR